MRKLSEVQRTNWHRLQALESPELIAEGLSILSTTSVDSEAEAAYWKIDGNAFDESQVREAAIHTIPALYEVIQQCSPAALPYALELLSQILARASNRRSTVEAMCIEEGGRGTAILFELLERSDDRYLSYCIDALHILGRNDPGLRKRVLWYFQQSAESCEGQVRKLLDACINELRQ